MSEPLDKPEHTAALDVALKAIDANALAAKSNSLTAGCLRGEDAVKVARMVALAAIRQPGKSVCVAGIRAEFNAGHLSLGLAGHITDIEIPTGEDI